MHLNPVPNQTRLSWKQWSRRRQRSASSSRRQLQRSKITSLGKSSRISSLRLRRTKRMPRRPPGTCHTFLHLSSSKVHLLRRLSFSSSPSLLDSHQLVLTAPSLMTMVVMDSPRSSPQWHRLTMKVSAAPATRLYTDQHRFLEEKKWLRKGKQKFHDS